MSTKAQGHYEDDLRLMVGQLLEASKSASEHLATLSGEVREHAKATAATAATLQLVEKRTTELSRVIHTGNGTPALISQVSVLAVEVRSVKEEVAKLHSVASTLKTQADSYGNDKQTILGIKSGVVWMIGVLIGLLTMALSVYGAFKR